jgi:hypothetical protein
VDTLRISASDVLKDVIEVVNTILVIVEERLVRFGKAPPSSDAIASAATSPMQVIGKKQTNRQAYDLPIDLRWGGGSPQD